MMVQNDDGTRASAVCCLSMYHVLPYEWTLDTEAS